MRTWKTFLGRVSCHDAVIVWCARLPDFFAKHVEDEREIIHAGVAPCGQHAVQAFAWQMGRRGQALKSDGAMDEITKGQTGERRFTLDEHRLGFVEER